MIKNPTDDIKIIEQSIKILSSLHKNLDNYINLSIIKKEQFKLDELLIEQIDFFRSIYDYIEWDIDIQKYSIYSSRDSISRILYNILNNACKYNTSNGFINIKFRDNILIIQNDSYGISNPSKVFDRFYKESDRGLGIGLHIVSKLAYELDIKVNLTINNNIVKVELDFSSNT